VGGHLILGDKRRTGMGVVCPAGVSPFHWARKGVAGGRGRRGGGSNMSTLHCHHYRERKGMGVAELRRGPERGVAG
jgi:hypothetical protein